MHVRAEYFKKVIYNLSITIEEELKRRPKFKVCLFLFGNITISAAAILCARKYLLCFIKTNMQRTTLNQQGWSYC